MKFRKELYAKTALMKATYNFTDVAYIHLDADQDYYYVTVVPKQADCDVDEQAFINEMLTQSVRHEVYQQTKSIRELLLARAMATSVIADEALVDEDRVEDFFTESDILKDWFEANEKADT